jgi:hypothetical protein
VSAFPDSYKRTHPAGTAPMEKRVQVATCTLTQPSADIYTCSSSQPEIASLVTYLLHIYLCPRSRVLSRGGLHVCVWTLCLPTRTHSQLRDSVQDPSRPLLHPPLSCRSYLRGNTSAALENCGNARQAFKGTFHRNESPTHDMYTFFKRIWKIRPTPYGTHKYRLMEL